MLADFELAPLSIYMGGGLIVVVTLILLVLNLRKRFLRANEINRQNTRGLNKELQKTTKQLLELRSIVVGLGQSLAEHQEMILHLEARINELEKDDKDARLYSRATKMVQLGADIDELVEECEIPKAEAELMLSLQKKLAGEEKLPPLSGRPKGQRNRPPAAGTGRKTFK